MRFVHNAAGRQGRPSALLAALLLLSAMPVLAQAPPACTRAREGQVACMAGTQCECRFERGGQMTGRPDRFAWDCGALRPACPPDPAIQPAPPWAPPGGVWVAPGAAPWRR